MKAAKGLAATGLLLATAGCLEPFATSSGAASSPYQPQPVVHAVDYYPPPTSYPPPYQPAPYQPPPLSPALTPQTAPMPVVGTSPGPVHYLPAPRPPTSLLGPQRAGWN